MRTEPLILFRVLMLSFVLGAVLGLGNDFLYFLDKIVSHIRQKKRGRSVPKGVLQGVRDVLFCFVAGFFITVILFYYNEGRLRAFSVMAVIFGFWLYRHSFGILFGRIAEPLSAKIGKGIYWAFACVARPIVRVSLFLVRTAMRPIRYWQKTIAEGRIQKYNVTCTEQLRKLAKKGFVKI